MKKGLMKTATSKTGVGSRQCAINSKASNKSSANAKTLQSSFALHSSQSSASLAQSNLTGRQANHYTDISRIGPSQKGKCAGYFEQGMRNPSQTMLSGTTAYASGKASVNSFKFSKGMLSFDQSNQTIQRQQRQPKATAPRANVKKAIGGATKTSAYLKGCQQKTKTNQFWSELTKIAEKAGKIETIDAKLNPTKYMGPSTSIETRRRTTPSREAVSHFRGQGGVHQAMNGVESREVRGSEHHEHNLEGRSMCAILQSEPRRAMTPKASTTFFASSAQDIGSSARLNRYEAKDPAAVLKPSANFRKANEASQDRLWTKENEFGLHEDKQLNRTQKCKAQSRERYFQSSISTLPGPQIGLNCVKTRNQAERAASESVHIERKKGPTMNMVFSSHINNLPGQHTSSQNTMQALEEQEKIRQSRKYNDTAFRMKNQALHGSYMMDADKGRNQDVPKEFASYRKDTTDNKWNRKPSNVSQEARHRLLYQSNFTLS